MKFRYIRRVGVLVFVLFLALTLTLALTAPGRATAAGGDQTETTSPEPEPLLLIHELANETASTGTNRTNTTVNVQIGQVVYLRAIWGGTISGPSTFRWTCEDGYGNPAGGLTLTGSNDKMLTIAVWSAVSTPVTITVTSTSDTGKEYKATSTLVIAEPDLRVFDHDDFTIFDGKSMQIGDTVNLDALWFSDTKPEKINTIKYDWKCSPNDVVLIKKRESSEHEVKLTALKEGKTTVTVEASWVVSGTNFGTIGKTALDTYTFDITVGPATLTITDAPANGTLKIGDQTTLKAEISNVNSSIKNQFSYTWAAADEESKNFVTVTTDGKVTAKAAGKANITVTATWKPDGKDVTVASESLTITVDKAEWKIYDNDDKDQKDIGGSLPLQIGESRTLAAEVSNLAEDVKDVKYAWKSSDVTVVTVVADTGVVTAQKAGKATITVTATAAGGVEVEKTLEVEVTSSTLKIVDGEGSNVTNQMLTLNIGRSMKLTAVLGDAKAASGVTYKWTADADVEGCINPDKFDSVNTDTITVTGIKEGTVTITVRAMYGGNEIGKASCKLTVSGPALTMEIVKDGNTVTSLPSMLVGEKATLTVNFAPDTAPVGAGGTAITPEYTWKCVAKDSETESGVVKITPDNADTVTITASKPGTAVVVVTVTWKDNSTAWKTVTVTYELNVKVEGPTLKIFSGTEDVTDKPVVLEPNKPVTLKVVPENVPDDAEYHWELEEKVGTVTISGEDTKEATVTTSKLDNPVTIKVTATWTDGSGSEYKLDAKCELTFAILVTEITLKNATVEKGSTVQLEYELSPKDATNKNITWTVTKGSDYVTVDNNGVVTGVNVGTAEITAIPEGAEDGVKATCTVTVVPPAAKELVFSTSSPIIWAKSDPATWDLSVALSPADAKPGDKDTITWSVKVKEGNPNNPLKLSGTGLTVSEDGQTASGKGTTALTARLTAGDPGVYIVTVTYVPDGGKEITNSIEVHVSGITLTRAKVTLLVGQNATIAIDQPYGFANSGVTNDVEWSTSDPSVVTVMHGGLTALKLGKAVITVTKNGYTAQCEVEVTEDGEAVADNNGKYYKATTGNPLNMSEVWDELDLMAQKKTGDRNEDGEWIKGTGTHLAYITNLSVPTSQGTLYYDYSSEANTGTGIRLTDRFAKTPDSTQKRIDRLYFVPRQGFKGTAEITFIGWAGSTSFSGVIKVEVSGADTSISYRTRSDTPLFFLANDFDAFSRSQKGRGVSYVTFDLPIAGQGVLYYNYLGGDGIRVSASTRFYQTGRYTIGDVCFVPNPTFAGEVKIKFHIVDTAGESLDEGWVVINVSPAGGDSTGIYLSGGQNDPVTFQAGLLNDICKNTINEPLNFVIFKLPALEDGILYYDYRGAGDFGSRVNATTRYFFSGVPGINNVTFVPAANATGRIAISYTGYGMSGNSFDGTLYIDLGGVNRTTIYYFASKNSSVTFNRADFNNAGLYQTGAGVSYVTFKVPDDTSLGTLYYDYRSSSNNRSVGSYSYYISPKSGQRDLALISFRAKGTTGSVTIPYTAYDSSNKKLFEGSVVIQVGSVTPVDTGVYCTASGYMGLSASALNSACRQAMNGSLSYIEITSLPGAEVGRLYLNYYGFGTGTAVKEGEKFYYSGSPGIGQLSFVPHAGFTGEAEITYIGYSGDGEEQVSGRIIVSVTGSRTTVFNDMGGYEWAIDSVNYLYQNGTVKGVGNNNYAPGQNVTRGDFILMLVRAYGFTASGSVSYHDVSASDYYAEAVRIATVLGIVQGYNGYFNPTSPISRQDAMVMIFRSLKASGMTITNGLAADLSAFYDRGQIDSYALEAVGSLVQMRVVEGDGNGYLRPRGLLNRAEAAKLLHTIMTL